VANRDAAPGFSDPDLAAWIGALRVLPTAPLTEADVLALRQRNPPSLRAQRSNPSSGKK
jgi:hypothetical protein